MTRENLLYSDRKLHMPIESPSIQELHSFLTVESGKLPWRVRLSWLGMHRGVASPIPGRGHAGDSRSMFPSLSNLSLSNQ